MIAGSKAKRSRFEIHLNNSVLFFLSSGSTFLPYLSTLTRRVEGFAAVASCSFVLKFS